MSCWRIAPFAALPIFAKMHLRYFEELADRLKVFHEIREPEPPDPREHPVYLEADRWRKVAGWSLLVVSGIPLNLVAVSSVALLDASHVTIHPE